MEQASTEQERMTGHTPLLPCPFCGSEAVLEECELTPFKKAILGATFSCGCVNEECIGYQSITTFARRSDAIKAWNTRQARPNTQQETGR